MFCLVILCSVSAAFRLTPCVVVLLRLPSSLGFLSLSKNNTSNTHSYVLCCKVVLHSFLTKVTNGIISWRYIGCVEVTDMVKI